MSNFRPTFCIHASAASFALLIALLILFVATYDFTNPDGTPDNALIRSLPAVLIVMSGLSLILLPVYFGIGKLQARFHRPSLTLVFGVATVAAISVSILFAVATDSGQGESLVTFFLVWGAVFFGAFVQRNLQIKQAFKAPSAAAEQ